jgi:hypothetical protein
LQKKDCKSAILPANAVQVKFIPDELLSSRARFRFNLTMQSYYIFLKLKIFGGIFSLNFDLSKQSPQKQPEF